MPVDIGQSAPDFTLPAANRDGSIALAGYRGKSPDVRGDGAVLLRARADRVTA